MKYLFFILFAFSITFAITDNDKNTVTTKEKSVCPYLEVLTENADGMECPFLTQSQKSNNECPYLSNKSKSDCPYLDGKTLKEGNNSKQENRPAVKIKSS